MSSMKCTIPGVNLKVFGRAIQSLSKIGDELYFEPLEDGLYLRSVNSCRSAYGCFQFSPSFFSNYIDSIADKDDPSDDEVLRCKLGMKAKRGGGRPTNTWRRERGRNEIDEELQSVMAVFKSLSTIDKMVEKCRISLDTAEARFVFQMYCRHGIIKTHKLAFTECETLQAVFSKDMCPNKLTAVPKLLCDAVLNFQNNQEEVTLIIRPHYMALKNYVEDEPDPNRVIHTELTLSPEEFEQYQAGVDADITFCLKELRAILAFADITGLPVTLQFETAGRPVTFSITSDLSFEANFVLATLAEVESSETDAREKTSSKSGSHDRRGNAAKQNSVHNGKDSMSRNSSSSRHPEKHKNSANTSSQSLNPSNRSLSLRDKAGPSSAVDEEYDNEELSVMMDVTVPEESYTSQLPKATSAKKTHEAVPQDGRKATVPNDSDNEDDDGWNTELRTTKNLFNPAVAFRDKPADVQRINNEKFRAKETAQISQNKQNYPGHSGEPQNSSSSNKLCDLSVANRNLLSLKSGKLSGGETSPVIPMQDTNLSVSDESDNEDEEIPATPPSKKFRSMFFGTQSSTQSTQSQQKSVILAADSEEDD